MSFNMMSKDTVIDDIEFLSNVFDFKFSITDDVTEGAVAEYVKHKFLGMERDFISIRPNCCNDYDRMVAVFLHEFGHLLDINLHGNAETQTQEIIASYVSVFLSTVLTNSISVEAIRVLASTIYTHGYARDNEIEYQTKAFNCIDVFWNVMTGSNNVDFDEFHTVIESYRDIIKEIMLNFNGDIDEAVRCLA